MINLLKKLFSSLLNFILLLAVTTLCAIFVTRNLLSGDNILGILNSSTINNNYDYSSLIPNNSNDNIYQNINEYIDSEELTEELGSLITDYLKYSSGIPGSTAPSTDELKEIIKESSKKYEEKTGQTINTEEINKQLDEIEIKLQEENEITKNNTYKQAFQFIYNDNYIYIAIAVIVVCIILILLLNKIENLIKHLIIVSLFNGIGNLAFGFALNKILASKSNVNNIVSNMTNTFNKIAIISFIISGVLLIIYIIIKVIKYNRKKKEESNTELNSINEYNNNINDLDENIVDPEK